MSMRNELRIRLTSATSIKTLAPLVRGKSIGNLSLGECLSADLTKPVIIKSDNGKFQQITMGNELTTTTAELIRSQPAANDVSINMFKKEAGKDFEQFQKSFLETCFLARVLLVNRDEVFSETTLDSIIRTAASATPAGRLMRELLSDFSRQPSPRDPPKGGIPGLPGIAEDLLVKAEVLRRKGCVSAVKSAMGKWGNAISSATPRYLQDCIDELTPLDNCPGENMTIRGRGLGDGTKSAVAFTRKEGGVLLTPASSIIEWFNDHITLTIPNGATSGPIGILIFPENPGDFASAAADAIAEIGGCFGPEVTMRMEMGLGRITAPLITHPMVQSNGANIYSGGPPIIEYFTVDSSPILWPGRTIRLSWSVAKADGLKIVSRNITGSSQHELPAITGTLTYPTGSVSVTIPGSRAWKGQYVLTARNRCTGTGAEEQAIDLEMVLRKGLALGGGGTRGDFQVGALLYLYEEKNFRPNAIAATSVGAINVIDLVMGDDVATATSPAKSAASRLADTWRSLVDESSMWAEEPWLTKTKAQTRQTIRSLSIEGLLALPYAIVTDVINISEVKDVFENPRKHGVVALFNLGPIETRARAQYQQTRADRTGIKLSLVSVSVETGKLVLVNEKGWVLPLGPQPTRPPSVPVANPTDVVDGAIASATMPGIFPARRLGDHMCVDGGVKEVVPVQIAVRYLGCNEVYAIRCSAPPVLQSTDPTRPVGEVMARSVLDLTYDAIADDDVAPFGGWGEKVKVTEIRPTFNLHDPMVVEPGLIRIALDYGWMRAADIIDVSENSRNYAMELSDKITRLRLANWILAHSAAGIHVDDPHRGFTDFVFAGVPPTGSSQLKPIPSPEAVDDIRANCRAIREAITQRLLISAPTQSTAARTVWFTQWETIDTPPSSNNPWAKFTSKAGTRKEETSPSPI